MRLDGMAALPQDITEATVKTDVIAHEELATWLVGCRGPFGGAGGESEAFEEDVVKLVDELDPVARGVDTELREANWFRRASVAQTRAMGRFVTGTRLGLSALGNAAGSCGDTYDKADRAGHHSFDGVIGSLAEFGA